MIFLYFLKVDEQHEIVWFGLSVLEMAVFFSQPGSNGIEVENKANINATTISQLSHIV